MFNWLREYSEIRREARICQSCEVLKELLAAERHDKQQLLNKLLADPTPEVKNETPIEITRPKVMPWRVKRQMLEAEDRAKAASMRNAAKPDSEIETLEKELDIAGAQRESQGVGDALG